MENLKTKTLVTGASGLIGSCLIKTLLERGHDVIAVTRERESLSWFQGRIIQAKFYELDWGAIEDIDVLFHYAAITNTSLDDEGRMLFINAQAPIKLFEEAIVHGCKKIVYTSSTAVYGNSPAPFVEGDGENPLNSYGKSKLLLDRSAMELADAHPETTIIGLRFCNVFGPGESHKGQSASMVYHFAQQILKGERPKLFRNGEQVRDHLYVNDAVSANLCAMNATKSCVVNCGSKGAVTFNEIVKILNEVLGTKKEPVYIDKTPPHSFQTHVECDMKKAEENLGFVSRFSFKEAVEDYYKTGKLAEPRLN
jgi:ADP-L-glycero-D-manno-heptose 6-epimerase